MSIKSAANMTIACLCFGVLRLQVARFVAHQQKSSYSASMPGRPHCGALRLFIFELYTVQCCTNQFFFCKSSCKLNSIGNFIRLYCC